MKKTWIRIGILFLGMGLWCLSLSFLREMEMQAGTFNGYYTTSVFTPADLQRFEEQAEHPESLPKITGWVKDEKQPIKGEVRESVMGNVWKIAGSMESFFQGQLSGGSYPWEEDEEGCMVSESLAEKLFGTQEVQGNQIEIAGEKYYIRGCIKSKETFAAVFAGKEEPMQGLFLEYSDKREAASTAQDLFTQMTGREPDGFWEGNLYSALARILAALPIWIPALVFAKKAYGQTNRISVYSLRLSVKLFAAAIVCGLVAFGFWITLKFSADYLPAMWSELDFFPELIAKKQKAFQEVCQFALCPADERMLMNLKKIVWAVFGSVLAEAIFLAGDKTKKEDA